MKTLAVLSLTAWLGTIAAAQNPAPRSALPPAGNAEPTTAGATAHKPATGTAGAAEHKPAVPATAQELEQQLETALHASPYDNDRIDVSVQGTSVTLAGTVHSAERKGLATRLVRTMAEKAGWTEVHVLNHLAVEEP